MQNRRTVKWLLLALLAVGVAYISIYGPRVFATKEYMKISPKGYYRLEYLKPGFPYLYSFTKDMPMIVRLYNNRTGELLGESDIVELSGNGEVFWTLKNAPRIRVGMDIVFPVTPEPD